MLAFQNLKAEGALKAAETEQGVEISALEGSLQMILRILNDVLDLQKMDSGRFEQSLIPFPFHHEIQSMLGTLRVSADDKKINLKIELDERIDALALPEHSDGLWVTGDSLRLRQVLSNLFSNAVSLCAFGFQSSC